MKNNLSDDIFFGEWLRQRRHILDLTQQELADRIGCARITLRRIEAGTLKPSKGLAEILLKELGVPYTDPEAWLRFARGLSGLPNQSNSGSKQPTSNLPASLTTFIGRRKEQSDVIRLIAKHRLVTLSGSGGIGKTRLSLKVGEQILGNYTDGVWLVELAPILDPLLVPRILAIAIGLRDEPQRPVIDMLCDYLRAKEMILILDNCEHLLEACAHVVNTLLKSCPRLKILATSREPLGVLGEAIYRVPSLGLPDLQQLLDTFRDFESVRLFEERAQLAQFDFSLTLENAFSVAQICHRLDGIPLAIELAAAKVGLFSTEQVAKQLDDRFNLLTEGNRTALPRHQTLRASMDWSWGLLTESEQTLMRQLSVFAGGWTVEAAQAICDSNIQERMHSLVKRSLVLIDQERGRYHFHETIRQYANEKLVESGEGNTLRDRHLAYFLSLVETAEPHLIRPEQIEWLPILDADYENIRLALEWALSKESAEPALNLCRALGWYWEIRCYWVEGLDWSTRVLAKPAQGVDKKERVAQVGALYTRAMLEWQLNNFEQILAPAEACLALAFENPYRKDIAIAKYFLAGALFGRGKDGDQARSLLEQSFAEFQELNEPFWQARVFSTLGTFLSTSVKSNLNELLIEQIELARKAGDRLTLADALSEYANWLFRNGQVDEAKVYAEESDRLYKQIGSENTSLNPLLFAEIAWNNGDFQTARSLYLELEQRFRRLGASVFRSNCIGKLGLLAMEEGDLDSARAYLEEGLSLEKEIGSKPWFAFYLVELGNLFYLQGDLEQFKQKVREGFALQPHFHDPNKTFILMTVLGSLYFQKPGVAARLLGIIDNHEKRFDLVRTPVEKRYCLRAEAYARQILGNAAFESTFAEGQKMSLDEALDLALRTVEEM
jgi:predicted ATPase/DNA-binding XRE family transcriptional regulator